MKAIILAGGRGERLFPLTENMPKPLVRLCGRPVIEYVLATLAKHGVSECVLALGHGAGDIMRFFGAGGLQEQITWRRSGEDGELSLKLGFCIEDKPRGTAGAAFLAASRYYNSETDEALLIVSADTLFELSLEEALAAHDSSGADVTIITVAPRDPREYGLLRTDAHGRVTAFLEKPSYTQAVGTAVNAGIYILPPTVLDMISHKNKSDFARDLFPALLQSGRHIAACRLNGYWRDIGSVESWLAAQSDLLLGRVVPAVPFSRDSRGNIVSPNTRRIHGRVTPPVYIGDGVRIAPGAHVRGCAVIEDGVYVASGAYIDGGVLLERSAVMESVRIDHGALCAGALASRGSVIEPCGVVGELASIGEGARVTAQSCVRGGLSAGSGEIIRGRGGSAQIQYRFDDDGICAGQLATPEFAARLGCAVGTAALCAFGVTVVGVCGGSEAAEAVCGAICCGIRAAGVSVASYGVAFESLFAHAMSCRAMAVGVYVGAGGRGGVKLLGAGGLPATRAFEAEVERALVRGDFARADEAGFGAISHTPGAVAIYEIELLRLAPKGLCGITADVRSAAQAADILRNTLIKLGAATLCSRDETVIDENAPKPVSIRVDSDGRGCALSQDGYAIDAHRSAALTCAILLEKGDVAVGNDFPLALDAYAREKGRRVWRYLVSCADEADSPGRELAASQLCVRDGLMTAVMLLSRMSARKLTLRELDSMLPAFEIAESTVDLRGTPALDALERLLCGKGEIAGEGVIARENSGIVFLRSKKDGRAIKIFAQAASFEAASELCGGFAARLSSLLDNRDIKRYNSEE